MPIRPIYTIPHHIDVFCEGGLLGWSVRTSFIAEPAGAYRIESYSDGAPNRGRKRRVNRPLGWREVARQVNKVGTLQLWGDFRNQVEINGVDEPWEREVIVALMLRGTDFDSLALGRFLLTLPDEDIARLYSLRGSLLTDESIVEFQPLVDALSAVRVRYRSWSDLKRLAASESDDPTDVAQGLVERLILSRAVKFLDTGKIPGQIDWAGVLDYCSDGDFSLSIQQRALLLAGWLKDGNPKATASNSRSEAQTLRWILDDHAEAIFFLPRPHFRPELEALISWTLEQAKPHSQTLSHVTPRTYGSNSAMILGEHRFWVKLGTTVQKAAEVVGIVFPREGSLSEPSSTAAPN